MWNRAVSGARSCAEHGQYGARRQTPILPAKQLEELGFAVVAYPTMITYAVARAAEHTRAHLSATGTTAGFEAMMEFDEFNRLIGVDEIRRKESALYGGLRDR